ncbi:hypothetical protein HXX76_001906 [Chlamydomonas incerta]|uniref:J domain-containing protein n=1 Tax=Chlamydomonas incerta TaxID=51695 RepID=A0A835WA20_CHLIN|nr:hypothetical protein HXX76_001906 [Chlamydomonas incerta]|eukprot:KAG2443554.1 hypothetical protein HXX76_001906 [Chlamydomonas incerta]
MTRVTYREALALLDLEGVPPPDVVRRAFRREALKWHPDKASAAADSRPEGEGPTSLTGAGAAASDAAPAPAPADPASQPASQPGSQPLSREAAEERFKRLAAAYHLLLRAADRAAALQATGSGAGGAGGAAAGAAARNAGDGGFGDQAQAQGPGMDVDLDDEALADALSADLLLEARRLRLSDFDMVFLHQRASVGAAGLPPEWSDAVRDVDDLWRRIRRRLERRRQRRQQQQVAAGVAGANGGGRGASGSRGGGTGAGALGSAASTAALPGSKWSLLFEFMADVVGADAGTHRAGSEDERERGYVRVAGGCSSDDAAGASSRAAASGRNEGVDDAEGKGGADGVWDAASAVGARVDRDRPLAPAAQLPQARRRGRLPPGFYWRWLRRLVALQLVVGVLFKR